MNSKINQVGLGEFLEVRESMKEYLQDEFEHIEEKYGFKDDENQKLMMAFFLYNCHDTISSIASEFSNVSKSTYPKDVYIQRIQETQQQQFELLHYDDIMDFLKGDKDVTREETMKFISDYFSSRDS